MLFCTSQAWSNISTETKLKRFLSCTLAQGSIDTTLSTAEAPVNDEIY